MKIINIRKEKLLYELLNFRAADYIDKPLYNEITRKFHNGIRDRVDISVPLDDNLESKFKK